MRDVCHQILCVDSLRLDSFTSDHQPSGPITINSCQLNDDVAPRDNLTFSAANVIERRIRSVQSRNHIVKSARETWETISHFSNSPPTILMNQSTAVSVSVEWQS